MNKIIIATNNPHKAEEIKAVLNDQINLKILSLNQFGIKADIEENGNTLEDNALIKARNIFLITNIAALSDDTGLFVNSLNDEPGVYSARYAGENVSYKDNCRKLLNNLKDVPDNKRNARFESVICFYKNEKEFYFFKGVCSGKISEIEIGNNGFGYDPLFIPDGMSKTFSELSDEEKNKISHRFSALTLFREFIDSAYL